MLLSEQRIPAFESQIGFEKGIRGIGFPVKSRGSKRGFAPLVKTNSPFQKKKSFLKKRELFERGIERG